MTVPKHLTDCFYCPHQLMHHSDEDGRCMVGESIGEKCYCPGFGAK